MRRKHKIGHSETIPDANPEIKDVIGIEINKIMDLRKIQINVLNLSLSII